MNSHEIVGQKKAIIYKNFLDENVKKMTFLNKMCILYHVANY